MSGKDAAMYMLFQVIGAFIGAGILMALAPESGLGANAVQQGITVCIPCGRRNYYRNGYLEW